MLKQVAQLLGAYFERLRASPKDETRNVPSKKRSLYKIDAYFVLPVSNAATAEQSILGTAS